VSARAYLIGLLVFAESRADPTGGGGFC
jgi:hypothetical protein